MVTLKTGARPLTLLTMLAPRPATRARWMAAYSKFWKLLRRTHRLPGSGGAWVTVSGSRRFTAAPVVAGDCVRPGVRTACADAALPGGGRSLCCTSPTGAVAISSFGAPGTASTAA